MAAVNIHRIRRMIACLRLYPEIQAIIARNDFEVASVVTMTLNLNAPSQNWRHDIACQRCAEYAIGRWRRRICERRGNAVLDTVIFEFESTADVTAFRDWLTARGW